MVLLATKQDPGAPKQSVTFFRGGQMAKLTTSFLSYFQLLSGRLLAIAWDWQLPVDLKRHPVFPVNIALPRCGVKMSPSSKWCY